MKKILLILLLSISSFAFSQNYQGYVPFPTSNVTWVDNYGCTENHHDIIGDTLINSKVYHKLHLNQKIYSHNWMGCSPNYRIQSRYAGAFRNDSLNKRVYFVASGNSMESLLYDFDLTVGDTLPQSLKIDSTQQARITVLRVDTVNYGGVLREQFTLNSCNNYIYPSDTIRWIEGIGSTQSLLYLEIDCPFESNRGNLVCMRSNTQTIYPDSSFVCQVLTGLKVEEVEEKSELIIFPNPTSGKVNLAFEKSLQSIEIYNLQGQKVQEVNPRERSWQLPEQNGLYLIRIQDEDVYTKKIIKN